MSEPGRARGRPPRTSREQIIDKAVELLLAEPLKPLSIHGLARALGLSPMALYHHVGGKDALLQAVAARLMAELQPQLPEGPWQQQLRAWAVAVRRHFLKYPVLLGLIGWRAHISSAWLAQVALLARILGRAGFADEALADAVQWTSATLFSAVYMEIVGRASGAQLSRADVDRLPEADAALMVALLPHLLPKRAGALFDDHVERVIEALEHRAPASHASRPAIRG